MNAVKTIVGIIIAAAGAIAAAQGYVNVTQCSSTWAQVANFFTSLVGGTAVQACYDAQIMEIGGIIVLLIGLVVIFAGNKKASSPAKKGRK